MLSTLPLVLVFYYAKITNGDYTPSLIRDYAVVESLVAGVDPQVITKVIDSESGFVADKVHYNDGKKGCNSVGLVQIRDCDHPTISKAQAEDPIFAVNFLIQNIDKCHSWWQNTCKGLNVQSASISSLTGVNQSSP